MPIDFSLTEEQELVCRTVDDLATELRRANREHESAGAISEAIRQTFHRVGLDRLGLPEALGGMNADNRLRALVNERLARGDAGAATSLQSWEPVVMALEELATEPQRDRLLRSVHEVTATLGWAAVALSEPLDVVSAEPGLATRAERVEGGFRLCGRKTFVARAEGASLILVFAQLSDAPGWEGVRGFVLGQGTPGLTLSPEGPRTGLRAVPTYSLELDGVTVGEARCLGAGSSVVGIQRLVARAALQVAARCVGVMDAAWKYARDYASDREAFGKPIAHFQAIAFMLADMATLTDAARWSVWQAAWELDTGDSLAAALAASAMVGEAVSKVTEDAVQILGGAGFVEDYPAEKWMRDARTLTLAWSSRDRLLGALAEELDSSVGAAPLFAEPSLQPVWT